MNHEVEIDKTTEDHPSRNSLMSGWTDLTVEHSPLGVLNMWGCYEGVRYEETLHLTNFEVAAISDDDPMGAVSRAHVMEKAIVRLMQKLKDKRDGN